MTRFASAFLTLQSLVSKKKELRAMVCSDEWEACKHTKTVKGKAANATIMSRGFWKNVSLCIKVCLWGLFTSSHMLGCLHICISTLGLFASCQVVIVVVVTCAFLMLGLFARAYMTHLIIFM